MINYVVFSLFNYRSLEPQFCPDPCRRLISSREISQAFETRAMGFNCARINRSKMRNAVITANRRLIELFIAVCRGKTEREG